MTDLPPLVARALARASEVGFPLARGSPSEEPSWGPSGGPSGGSASLPDVGRFLAVLAAGCAGGRIGELGTGVGIGTAWMAGAMPGDCRLITAEIDPERARVARELFSDDPHVEVITGDAVTSLAGRGPFDLLFADGGGHDDVDLVGWLRIGGRVVKDDVTPRLALPPGSPLLLSDAKRDFFSDTRLISTEVVLPDLRNSLLVGTRTR